MKPKKQVKSEFIPQTHISVQSSFIDAKNYGWFVGITLLLTAVAYFPNLFADFVTWDDGDYVMDNEIIRNFDHFSKFFTTSIQGNYHPITMISLAINYAISGDDASSYHLFNIIFHLLNVVLVFKFICILTKDNYFIAFFTALFFGIHPMHVESVAWVSERKDVLYTLFFLLGLMSYIKLLDTGNKKYYWITFLWFILSLASKPAAIIFPVALFTLDYVRSRTWSMKWIYEKIPFFLCAAFMVYLTLHAQKTAGATDTSNYFNIGKRILFASYGHMMYIVKMIWPFNLATFYPFPPINENLSKIYFFAPFFTLGIAYLCWKGWKENRSFSFGILFFTVNLLLVLQFFIVGSAIIADRYTYIPYIGLFFSIGWWLESRWVQNQKFLLIGIMLIAIFFTYLSNQQVRTWNNTAALWDGAIKNYPSAKAYTNRAYIHQLNGEYDKALLYYDKSIKYNVTDPEVYANKGSIYYAQDKDSLALYEYNRALAINPNHLESLNGRGSVYGKFNKSDLAIADFSLAITKDPTYQLSYKNRAAAYVLIKRYDDAINDYKKFMELNPDDVEAMVNMGAVYLNKGDITSSVDMCKKAIQKDPKFIKAYINIGGAYSNAKDYPNALLYLNKAFELDSTNEENLKFLSLTYVSMGNMNKALSYYAISQRNNKSK